jgi:ribosomal protein L16/L10AE
MSDITTKIACMDCGQERTIKVQDAFQVKRCATCQTKFRRKLDAQRRKAKRAIIGTIWIDANTVVTVTRPEKSSERFTVVGTVPVRWEAVIEDGVDMYIVTGDKSHLPTAIEAVRIFNDGRWDLKSRLEEENENA